MFLFLKSFLVSFSIAVKKSRRRFYVWHNFSKTLNIRIRQLVRKPVTSENEKPASAENLFPTVFKVYRYKIVKRYRTLLNYENYENHILTQQHKACPDGTAHIAKDQQV